MALSLSDLKKSSKVSLTTLIEESNKSSGTTERKKDVRFWQPTVDQAGNGNALIRFLPAPFVDGEDGLPWAKYWSHGFKGPSNKWYIEWSLTSIGQPDPVSEYNSKLWATEDPELQAQVRRQKRKQNFVANILVINDPAKPENNGKVFLFQFGQKIWDKIKGAMAPDEELGEEPTNPFDFWEGQNFKLKIKKVGDYRNYDDSGFSNVSAISKKDDEIEAIWKSEYSLKEFTNPNSPEYKSYDELKEQLYKVLEIRDESVSSSVTRLAMQAESAATDSGIDLSDDDDATLDAVLKNL